MHGRVARTRARRSDSNPQAWVHPCLPPSIRNVPSSARPQLGPLIPTMSATVTDVPSLFPRTSRQFLRGFTPPYSKLQKKRQKCCGWTGPLHSPPAIASNSSLTLCLMGSHLLCGQGEGRQSQIRANASKSTPSSWRQRLRAGNKWA